MICSSQGTLDSIEDGQEARDTVSFCGYKSPGETRDGCLDNSLGFQAQNLKHSVKLDSNNNLQSSLNDLNSPAVPKPAKDGHQHVTKHVRILDKPTPSPPVPRGGMFKEKQVYLSNDQFYQLDPSDSSHQSRLTNLLSPSRSPPKSALKKSAPVAPHEPGFLARAYDLVSKDSFKLLRLLTSIFLIIFSIIVLTMTIMQERDIYGTILGHLLENIEIKSIDNESRPN